MGSYTVYSCALERISLVDDLGFHFDRKLKFAEHISNLAKKAMGMLGFIKKSCKEFEDPEDHAFGVASTRFIGTALNPCKRTFKFLPCEALTGMNTLDFQLIQIDFNYTIYRPKLTVELCLV